MRQNRIWAHLLGVENMAVVESVELEDDDDGLCLVARVRKHHEDRGRCSRCMRRCPRYDTGSGRRRWRALDLGPVRAFVEAEAPRLTCPEHGVVVENSPWAHGQGRFTRAFENTVAWLAARTDKTAVSTLARIAWRTVGGIIERVVDVQRKKGDPLDGVSRIGVDEVSYRRGHRYLTVVIDHDTGRLLFAHRGKDAAALEAFFDAAGDRADHIKLISLDAAPHFNEVCRRRCPSAGLCMDPFHVVKWATDAVDKVRRRAWNQIRSNGSRRTAAVVKGSRYAVLKNPEDLNEKQRLALTLVEKHNRPLFRAYLLKEQLRAVFQAKDVGMLSGWLAWARRSRLPEFVDVARSIERVRAAIEAALKHGLSNARVEGLNTRMQLLTRVAFGFHSSGALIALAMLKLGGFCPSLPGRATHGYVR
jgi:transposase